jgi:hypothetical protein
MIFVDVPEQVLDLLAMTAFCNSHFLTSMIFCKPELVSF